MSPIHRSRWCCSVLPNASDWLSGLAAFIPILCSKSGCHPDKLARDAPSAKCNQESNSAFPNTWQPPYMVLADPNMVTAIATAFSVLGNGLLHQQVLPPTLDTPDKPVWPTHVCIVQPASSMRPYRDSSSSTRCVHVIMSVTRGKPTWYSAHSFVRGRRTRDTPAWW